MLKEENFSKFESLCKRCGKCCGSADNDPCEHLSKDAGGMFFCEIYENRFGPKKTVSGKIFTCVPIRDVARDGYLRPGCAYNGYIPFAKT